MSNPIETLFNLPRELGMLIASSLSAKDLLPLRTASTQGHEVVRSHLQAFWNSLERSPPAGPLNLTGLMGRLRLEHPDAPHLHLFKSLTRAIAVAGELPCAIALTRADFEQLQESQVAHDEALLAFWPRILAALNIPNPPQINTAEEIRAWMNDPNNAVLLSGITYLNLSNLKLKVLPPEITKLPLLRGLGLSGNRLRSLPDSIGNLSQLQELYLSNNWLTSLPDSIGNLSQLQGLYLGGNQLTSLPDAIGNLSRLKELYLAGNQLTSLPDAIGNLSQLQDLYLAGNQLTSLPNSIGNLRLLDDLYLAGNQLTSLPDSIKKLDGLSVLGFDEQLTKR